MAFEGSPNSRCICSRISLLSSTSIFLALVLPSTTYAQDAQSGQQTPSQDSPPTQTNLNSNSSPTSTSDVDFGIISNHVVKYYFLVIALAIILVCLVFLFIGNRKRRKAASRRATGQRALARDVEGFGNRWMSRGAARDGEEDLGLDGRGEAPPPYVRGTKPPSVRSTDYLDGVHRQAEADSVELRGMEPRTRLTGEPPEYHEHTSGSGRSDTDPELGDLNLARPSPAVTMERYGSIRRLLSSSHGAGGNESSSQRQRSNNL